METRNIEIRCQNCMNKPKGEGCARCGGSGTVLTFVPEACPICKRPAWVKPGVFTKFEGKTYYTFDGLLMIAHLKKPDNCIDCEVNGEQTGDQA